MTRAVRTLLVAAVAMGTFVTTGAAAYALWSNTATATLTGVTTVDVSPVPAAPVTATCTGTGDPLTLSWSASSGATEYRVYRTTTAVTLLRTVTTTSTSFSQLDMGSPQMTGTQAYNVVVRAYNLAGESGDSPTVILNFKGNKAC